MDTARWPQEIVMKPLEEIVVVPSSNNNNNQLSNSSSLERKLVRPQKEEALNCPRCNSTNTKFCYYNNYSLTQPRYFCKACKRYWTQGGSLRNIPIGGASRTKNKRSSSAAASKKLPDLVLTNSFDATIHNNNNSHHLHQHQNPKIHQGGGQDLNLGFPNHDLKTISQLIQVPNFESPSSSAMELLNGMSSSSRGYLMNSFMPMPVSDPSTMYSSGFSLQDLKPNLNFTLDHTGIGISHEQEVQENTNSNNSCGKLLFPFEDLKQQQQQLSGGGGTCNNNNNSRMDQQQEHRDEQEQGDSNGYWSGVLGSGSW